MVLKPSGVALILLDAASLPQCLSPEFVIALFERFGFALAERKSAQSPVKLTSAGLVFVRDAARVRARKSLQGLLEEDRKTTTYKLALIKALAEINLSNSARVRYLSPTDMGSLLSASRRFTGRSTAAMRSMNRRRFPLKSGAADASNSRSPSRRSSASTRATGSPSETTSTWEGSRPDPHAVSPSSLLPGQSTKRFSAVPSSMPGIPSAMIRAPLPEKTGTASFDSKRERGFDRSKKQSLPRSSTGRREPSTFPPSSGANSMSLRPGSRKPSRSAGRGSRRTFPEGACPPAPWST